MKTKAMTGILLTVFLAIMAFNIVPVAATTFQGKAELTCTDAGSIVEENGFWITTDQIWSGPVYQSGLLAGDLTMTINSRVHIKTGDGVHSGTFVLTLDGTTYIGKFSGRLEDIIYVEGKFIIDDPKKTGTYQGKLVYMSDTSPLGNEIDLWFWESGFDEYGYNYDAMLFVGKADGVDRNLDGTFWGDPTFADWRLIMKWNIDWHEALFGLDDSWEGAWLTNEWEGIWTDEDGNTWHITYFLKIVYSSEIVDADGDGFDDNTGAQIIWGSFLIIQEVMSYAGVLTLVIPPGFGVY